MRDKRRGIPCGSPPEDDQVVRRCCSRLRGVVLVFIALFGPICAVRIRCGVCGYALWCVDTIMWANFAHVLRGSGARVSARLWSTQNWIRLLGSKVVTGGFSGR